MSLGHLRPLSFGEILDGAFVLYRQNFATLVLTALIPFAPIALLSGISMGQVAAIEQEVSAGTVVLVALMALVGTVGGLMVWAALTRQASQAVVGEVVSVRDAYAAGLRSFLPLLGAGIVAYIALFAVMFALILVLGILGAVLGALGGVAGAVIFAVLTAVVMVAFMLGLFGTLFAVAPAVVIERKGPVEALQRSWNLARGARGRVVGVCFVSWLIVSLPMGAIMAAVGFETGTFTAAPDAIPMRLIFWQQVLGVVAGALTVPFFVATLVLLYYDRRVRTEALDLEVATERLGAMA